MNRNTENVEYLDTGEIWNRLFDHRAFLNGEIQFTLKEFEVRKYLIISLYFRNKKLNIFPAKTLRQRSRISFQIVGANHRG